jgi:hypothetical protein
VDGEPAVSAARSADVFVQREAMGCRLSSG